MNEVSIIINGVRYDAVIPHHSSFGSCTCDACDTDKGTFVQCGCFRGSLDEFVAKVKETHARTKHERDYNALIDFVKIKFSDYT